MKYYYRKVLVREPINRFGKLGYKRHLYLLKLKDESALPPYNKGKHILFSETQVKEYIRILRHQPIGQIYDITLD